MSPCRRRWFVSLACALLAACSKSSSDNHSFEVRNAAHATTSAKPPVVVGGWALYYADEAQSGPLDLNGDGDTLDTIACALNVKQQTDTVLGVSATDIAVIGNEIYLAVSEADDATDWNNDSDTLDLVLMHWRYDQGLPPVYVDTLAPAAFDASLVAGTTRVYYSGLAAGPAAGETSLRFVDLADPLVPASVFDADGQALIARPYEISQSLLFVACDETASGLELNGDGDMADTHVLALLDTTDADFLLKNVGLALSGSGAPVAASATGEHDWTVAFLVSEAAQGADLNDPALFAGGWVAQNCGGAADGDMMDGVLHWLTYESWFDGMSQPLNTGLVGAERVIAFDEAVATLSPESDAGCDLDDDGDMLDLVPRWVETLPNALPPGAITQLLAVRAIAGGSSGLAWNGQRLVAVLSEELSGRDLDTSAELHDLVAWLDPADGDDAAWHVQHPTNSSGTGIQGVAFAGADWMAAKPLDGRLGIGFQESVAGDLLGVPSFSLNNCLEGDLFVKDSDGTDSMPVWSDFESGPSLDFDGIGYATATNNAGLVVARGNVYFRGSEQNDNHAYNEDADLGDDILFRNPVAAGCQAIAMSTAASLDGPVIYTDGVKVACFYCDEAQAGLDLDGDGDTVDLVLRYFAF